MTAPHVALEHAVATGGTYELCRAGAFSLTAVAGEDMPAGTLVRIDLEGGRMILRRWSPNTEEGP